LRWGHSDDKAINPKLLAYDECINEDPLNIPNSVVYVSAARDISELSDDTDLNGLFFVHFFPSVVEQAKIIDESYVDLQSPFHNTVKNDKVQFDDPEAEDSDWKVKQAYTLMIVVASEIKNGVKNV
jgi:hypothetical protein